MPEPLDREALRAYAARMVELGDVFGSVGNQLQLASEFLAAEQRAEEAKRQLRWAIQLLRREEWHAGRTHKDHCPTCGYPKVRGHEPGCSLDAVLNGRPAPRLDRCNDALAPHKAAEEEQC